MDTVYIETSIVSHVAARFNSDWRIAALQHQAHDWWFTKRTKFQLVTSQLVINEAAAGDSIAAAARLRLLDGLAIVPIDENVRSLARAILAASILPPKAAVDALHIAAAAVAEVEYLLTLNCKHIANAHELPRVYKLLEQYGYGRLLICTPAQFLGGDDYESYS